MTKPEPHRGHGRMPVSYILFIVAAAAVVMLWVSTNHRTAAYTQGVTFGSAFGPLCSPALENYCLREYGNLDSFHRQVKRVLQLVKDRDEADEVFNSTMGDIGDGSATGKGAAFSTGRRLLHMHPLEVRQQENLHQSPHHNSGCIMRTADLRAELLMSLGALRAEVYTMIKDVRVTQETADQLAAQAAGDAEMQQAVQEAQLTARRAQEEAARWKEEAAKWKEQLERVRQGAQGQDSSSLAAEVAHLKEQLLSANAAAEECPKCEESAVGAGPGTVALNTTAVVGAPVTLEGVSHSLVLPKNDEFVAGWVVANKVPVDSSALHKMLSFIRPGATVVDVGAAMGSFAIWFARAAGDAGKVWAIEPQPYIYQVLCANVVINGYRNVQTVNAALSFKRGMATMDGTVMSGASRGRNFSDAATDLASRVDFSGRRLGVGGERVPMLTLDSMQLPRLDYLKVDVVGTERLVLWGAQETIQRLQPVVSFKQGSGPSAPANLQQALDMPADVATFQMGEWLQTMGYQHLDTVQQHEFWVPHGGQGL